MAFLAFDAKTFFLAFHVVAKESEDGRQLCAFGLFLKVERQTAGLEFFSGQRVVLFLKCLQALGNVCRSELRAGHRVEEVTKVLDGHPAADSGLRNYLSLVIPL